MNIHYDRGAIRRLRTARGLSIDELSSAARITDRTLSYIEKGYSDPRASTLAKLARALGVSTEEFFVRKDTPVEASQAS